MNSGQKSKYAASKTKTTSSFMDLHQPRPSLSVHSPSRQTAQGNRLLEIRLMHHYTAVVCHLMPRCGSNSSFEVWGLRIPNFSFRHEMILDLILSLSALHLLTQSIDDNALLMAMSKYLDRALVNYRQCLPKIEGDLAEPLFLASVILSHLMWLICHRSRPEEDYQLPLQAYYLIRGISVMFFQRRSFFEELGYSWFGDEDPPPIAHHITVEQQRQLRGIEEDIQQLFDHFDVQSRPILEQEIYEEAAAFVLWLYRGYFCRIDKQHLQRCIRSMPLRLRPTFLTLLEKNDPLAMALLARALLLVSKIGNTWWIQGGGPYETVRRDIHGIFELMPRESKLAIAWPYKVISGEAIFLR